MATRSISLAAAGVLAILGAAGSASAQVLPYGPMLYRVTATRSDGVTGFVEFSSLDGNYNSDPANPSGNDGYWNGYDHYDWTMSIATAIHGPGGELLGRINSAHIEVDSDPFVLANFNVTAGSLNTTFNVSSSNLVVAPSSYTGQASAQVTLTDNDGDGALLAVSTTPAGMYRAMYNPDGVRESAQRPGGRRVLQQQRRELQHRPRADCGGHQRHQRPVRFHAVGERHGHRHHQLHDRSGPGQHRTARPERPGRDPPSALLLSWFRSIFPVPVFRLCVWIHPEKQSPLLERTE